MPNRGSIWRLPPPNSSSGSSSTSARTATSAALVTPAWMPGGSPASRPASGCLRLAFRLILGARQQGEQVVGVDVLGREPCHVKGPVATELYRLSVRDALS